MESYLDILISQHRALHTRVSLASIFLRAGLSSTTYWRAITGRTEISYTTAMKVYRYMELLNGANLKRNEKRRLTPEKAGI